VEVTDLAMFRRFAVEPGLIGPNWYGFRDPDASRRRFETDGFLGTEDSRLVVCADGETAGFVGWHSQTYAVGKCWNIGIVLLPEWRGRGVGWRAQAMLCDYLFQHSPLVRIEATTQPNNVAEQRALGKAGFTREGVLRSAEFRDGDYRDVWVYSRLRSDPPPSLDAT